MPLSRRQLLSDGLKTFFAGVVGMTIFDDAVAKATEAQAAGNQCQQQLAAMTAERDALQVQVADLQQQLDDCLGPPGAAGVSLGCSERFFDEFRTSLNRPLMCERVFAATQAIGGSDYVEAVQRANEGIVSLVDTKQTTAAFWDQMGAWAAGLSLRPELSYHHEPEGDMTPATFISRHQGFYNAIAGRADVAWNVMGQSFRDGVATQYYPGDAFVDVIAVDAYYKGASIPYPTTDFVFGRAVEFAEAHGKPLALYEWGVKVDMTGSTPQMRADKIDELHAYVKTKPVIKRVVYWESDVPGDNFQIRNEAVTMDAFRRMADDPHFQA